MSAATCGSSARETADLTDQARAVLLSSAQLTGSSSEKPPSP